MKSYTDLEQSKELTKILPIESADMKYPYFGDGQYGGIARFGESIEFSGGRDIPCWSFALLDILPHRIDDRYELVMGKLSDNKGWYVCYDDIDHYLKYYVANVNLVDACYEMIIKLHEQKLL